MHNQVLRSERRADYQFLSFPFAFGKTFAWVFDYLNENHHAGVQVEKKAEKVIKTYIISTQIR